MLLKCINTSFIILDHYISQIISVQSAETEVVQTCVHVCI